MSSSDMVAGLQAQIDVAVVAHDASMMTLKAESARLHSAAYVRACKDDMVKIATARDFLTAYRAVRAAEGAT